MGIFWSVIKTCLKKKLFITGGRAGRTEFWLFSLFACFVYAIFFALHRLEFVGQTTAFNGINLFGMVFTMINFICFVGQYSAIMRRLHDTNRNGAHILPIFIGLMVVFVGFIIGKSLLVQSGEILSVLGTIYVIVVCCLPGTKGNNNYGAPVPTPGSAEEQALLQIQKEQEEAELKAKQEEERKNQPEKLDRRARRKAQREQEKANKH